jgi:NICE-3 protein
MNPGQTNQPSLCLVFGISSIVKLPDLFHYFVDSELKRCGMSVPRKPGTPLKLYLLDARQNGRPLEGARLDLVEKFANTYEHARHDPSVRQCLLHSIICHFLQWLRIECNDWLLVWD